MNATYETANATADGLGIECVRLVEEDVISGSGAKVLIFSTSFSFFPPPPSRLSWLVLLLLSFRLAGTGYLQIRG